MSEHIGKPLSRLDGRAKVTGAATYAAEFRPHGVAHAALVSAAIAHGRLTAIDADAAERAPGVLTVFTPATFPRLDASRMLVPPLGQSFLPLQDDRVLYSGQPIALVVAETLEQAEHASRLVHATYQPLPVRLFAPEQGRLPSKMNFAFEPVEQEVGDVEAGLAEADVVVTGSYTLPARHHNPMEPFATVAEWDGDVLTLHTATQWSYAVRIALARLFGLPPENIRVHCPFTGGGFGSKGFVWPHQMIAAAAARVLRRPLKLVLTRAQMYTACGFQPAIHNDVRLGAKRDGRLTAIHHETTNVTSVMDDYVEFGAAGTRGLYAAPHMKLVAKVAPANVGTPTAMRAPHEGPGMFALETAMDELAYALDMDPLELRLRNDTPVDPSNGKPYSTRKLKECYLEGARRFGWSIRPMPPGSLRDGHLFVGWGMASAIMSTFRFPAAARLRMTPAGRVTVEAAIHELGNGTYTIFPQIAGDVLGIDPAHVEMHLGSTDLPDAGPTTGSSATMGLGSAVHAAAADLRQRLVDLALAQPESPLHGMPADSLVARDGGLAAPGNRFDTYGDILLRAGAGELVVDGSWSPGAPFDAAGHATPYSMRTFGAVFAEVTIDPDLGLVRLRRCVGVYNAGRIINPNTARSQMTGAMIWGCGQALLEESTIEPACGAFLSKNLAGVMLPVSADIPDLDVAFVEDHDPHASTIGARGIGELGAVGVSAAIGNAVFHATGKRIRELPIRIEAVLAV